MRGNEETIAKYVQNQGKEKEYQVKLKQPVQLSFFS